MGKLPLVKRGAGHMLSEKSQRTHNGTMFVDLDWTLNASRRLSASAELPVTSATRSIARYLLRQRDWVAGWMSHAGIVSKRLNLP